MTPGRKPIPLADRIYARITLTESGCWVFDSLNQDGYGVLWTGSRVDGTRRLRKAHVVSYETFEAEIPAGLVLDHLCRNRACVNPEHLEPVTHAENLLRSPDTLGGRAIRVTACPQGHPYNEANTMFDRHGKRYCKPCRRSRDRAGRPLA